MLIQEGFTCDSYIPFTPNDEKYPYKCKHNLTYFPIYLMKHGCPLIKVKIIENPLSNFDGDKETLAYIKDKNLEVYNIIVKDTKRRKIIPVLFRSKSHLNSSKMLPT